MLTSCLLAADKGILLRYRYSELPSGGVDQTWEGNDG